MLENMLNIIGRGYGVNNDGNTYEKELYFASSVLKNDANYYRFVYVVFRDTDTSQSTHGYLGIAHCNSNGSFKTSSGGRSAWASGYASNGNKITISCLLYIPTGQSWTLAHDVYPTIDPSFATMVTTNAAKVYREAMAAASTGTYEMNASIIQTKASSPWTSIPMVWAENDESPNEIVKRARSLSHLVYWYGGAGQTANQALLDSLTASYPSTYNDTNNNYITKCKADIKAGKQVGDCSYLVNYAYGKASPGNHGSGSGAIANSYSLYGVPGSITPKDGMILWKAGHVGIYWDNKVIELRGIDYDYKEDAYDLKRGWKKILYDKNISYD